MASNSNYHPPNEHPFGGPSSGGGGSTQQQQQQQQQQLHPFRSQMGNLAQALRRSMPSVVNANQQQQSREGGSSKMPESFTSPYSGHPTSRHLSFCCVEGPTMEEGEGDNHGQGGGAQQQQQQRRSQLKTTNSLRSTNEEVGAAGAATPTMDNYPMRSTSAHSHCSSLSPSGSLIFGHGPTSRSGVELRNIEFVTATGNSAAAVDTRQIQVFMKKQQREDSRTILISSSTGSTTKFISANENGPTATGEVGGPPPLPPHPPPLPHPSSSSSSSASQNQLRNSRKMFRSSDTRSSIFSVSSSMDSAKEERIIANLEHHPASTMANRVVVLPRPLPLAPSHSLHDDDHDQYYGGNKRSGQKGTNGSGEGGMPPHQLEKQRSSSAEHRAGGNHQQQNCSSSSRRTSIDFAAPSELESSSSSCSFPAPPPSHSPPSHHQLSSWHSISDLNSSFSLLPANGNGQEGTAAAAMASVKAPVGDAHGGGDIWHSPPPPRPQSHASIRRSNYLGELVWQVDETVYCGGIEAAQNQNLLCRLNIEYIVDLSGQEDDPTLANSRPRTEYPCLCPKRTAHSRLQMSIRVKDDSQQMLTRDSRPSTVDTKTQLMEREEIIHYFEALIDLIRKARISQKKVLIHSLKGRNRAPAFVAAYLMHCNRQTRVHAINKITRMMSSMRPGICISDNLQRALMRWQSILGIRAESSRLDSQQLNKMFAVKRTAWN